MREVIVHREGLCATTFDDNGWQANLISVHQDFVECLKRLGDTNQNYKQTTDFGVHKGSFLSPYIFSKKIAGLLFAFCDKYLQLMGYPNFIEQQPNDSTFGSFSNTLTLFKRQLGVLKNPLVGLCLLLNPIEFSVFCYCNYYSASTYDGRDFLVVLSNIKIIV